MIICSSFSYRNLPKLLPMWRPQTSQDQILIFSPPLAQRASVAVPLLESHYPISPLLDRSDRALKREMPLGSTAVALKKWILSGWSASQHDQAFDMPVNCLCWKVTLLSNLFNRQALAQQFQRLLFGGLRAGAGWRIPCRRLNLTPNLLRMSDDLFEKSRAVSS